MQSIAKKYKISVSDLINWNKLYKYNIAVGQELAVNSSRAGMSEIEKAQGTKDKTSDQAILKEETLVGIAYYNPKAPFKGVYCNNVPRGKLVYILNKENFIQYYGRVAGPLPKNVPPNTIIQVDNEVAKRLQITNPTINIKIWFGMIDSE